MTNEESTNSSSRLRTHEIAVVGLVGSMMGLTAALLSLPVQWRSSTFPFGLNDFDPMGLILMLAGACCGIFCWIPASVGILFGIIAATASHSRRRAICSIIIGLAAIGTYSTGALLWR